MKKKQILILIAIIFLPVLAGIVVEHAGNSTSKKTLTSPLSRSIGLVRIVDVIYDAEEPVRQLREMREDDKIAAVVLRIESPGGAVAPSQEIYQEVLRFRAAGKPVIASIGTVGASGGYYIASAAEKIFANSGSITGSIGVIFQFGQFYKLMDKIGVSFETIKSGKYKDVGNPNRAMTDGERQYMQNLIDDTYEQFLTDVSIGRTMALDTVRRLAEGKIYTGRQAKKVGLVDTLGTFDDALSFCKKRVGLPDRARVVEKRDSFTSWKDIVFKEVADRVPFLRKSSLPMGTYFLWGG